MRAESRPAVIDFEALLKPISEENPSGEDLKYSGLYDEIREARRSEIGIQGDWQQETKTADYKKVIQIATSALASETKDLQITAWLVEALVREHGFVGLRDGLRLVRCFHETFWETMHPQIDEGDMEARANAVEWIGEQMGTFIRTLPLTGGQGFSYVQWEESKKFDFPDNIDSLDYHEREKMLALKAQAEEEKRVTGSMWRIAKSQTRRAFYEDLNLQLEECWAEYQALESAIEEKYDRNQTPSLRTLQKSLDDIRALVKNLLEEKRAEEPDLVEETQEEVVDKDGQASVVKTTGTVGPIQSRQDALRRLAEIAEYFRKNEPHSPVSYLIQRAIKWGNMPLEGWLQDVIKDEGVIYQIRQTLGFNTPDSYESKSD
ncbi:MAG: type VI secretion system protein TssA [Pyrinomonadaceae bacterium]|nr:type VI secretion system protein TssA [Pyrinomonadaceae bacterium]MCX7639075.1 type VI secretion system protein TssA [Pyrinomonadaceae bacterium]MDW8303704.1 type VI secretion system protein TssA [Acidobacteriota bacterium]